MTGSRLLLVDDDPDLALALRVLCRRGGLTCAACGDVEAAWQAVQAEQPDLVLLDVNLPGLSGLELLRRIRAAAALSALPVALFLQSGLHRDVAAGWAAGASYLVAKELVAQPEAFSRRIAAVLANVGGRSAVADLVIPLPGERPWTELFRRTVRRLAPAVLPAALVPPVVARAFRSAFGPEVAQRCLSPEGDKVIGLPRNHTPDQGRRVFESVGEQVWALHGDDALERYRTLLHVEPNPEPG
ncbi:MAG: response regulator [Gemmataceae bacterium]